VLKKFVHFICLVSTFSVFLRQGLKSCFISQSNKFLDYRSKDIFIEEAVGHEAFLEVRAEIDVGPFFILNGKVLFMMAENYNFILVSLQKLLQLNYLKSRIMQVASTKGCLSRTIS
jgi:hypothetical protein